MGCCGTWDMTCRPCSSTQACFALRLVLPALSSVSPLLSPLLYPLLYPLVPSRQVLRLRTALVSADLSTVEAVLTDAGRGAQHVIDATASTSPDLASIAKLLRSEFCDVENQVWISLRFSLVLYAAWGGCVRGSALSPQLLF